MNLLAYDTIQSELFTKLEKHDALSFAKANKFFMKLFNLHVKVERKNILKQWKLDPCNAIRKASSERYTDLVLSFIKDASDLILNAGMLSAAERGHKDIVLLLIDHGADAYSEGKDIASNKDLKNLLHQMEKEDTIKYDNKMRYRGRKRNGKEEGIHKKWDERWLVNVPLIFQGAWKNGVKEGIHKTWYRNGKLVFQEKWKNGVKEGICESWHPSGCQLRSQGLYQEGEKNGIFRGWYQNGQLRYQIEWKNGYMISNISYNKPTFLDP